MPHKNKADRNARAQARYLERKADLEAYEAFLAKGRETAMKYKNANREQVNADYKDWYHNKGGKEIVAARRNGKPKTLEAARRKDLKRLYGITPDEYMVMWNEQGGKCKICGNIPMKTLAVDHDHATGKVRGLLCHQCNCVLGYAKDNIDVLKSAIAYLEQGA